MIIFDKNKIMEKVDSISLLAAYTDYVMLNNKQPSSVYSFCKDLEIEENDFYKYYSSFDAIEESVFPKIFEDSIALLKDSDEYEGYDKKTKMLSFYFTYFEHLTANRSLVMYVLRGGKVDLKQMLKLKKLRTLFQLFVKSLDIQVIDIPKENVQKIQDKAIEELAWGQFLLTLKFWMEDVSPSFEKTDVFIEKSVHASFDLINLAPFKNIIDFGKFFWKEKMKM